MPQPAITFPPLQYQMLRLNTIRYRNNIPRSAIPDPITARIKFTLDCSPPTRTLVAVSSNPYQPPRPKGIQPEQKIVWLLSVQEYCHCHTVLSTWRTLQFSGSITTEPANGRITAEAIYKFCVLWNRKGWFSPWQDGHSNNSVRGGSTVLTRTGGSHHYCFRLASVKISRTCGFWGEQIVNVFSHHLSELSNISWLCGFSAVEPFAERPEGWWYTILVSLKIRRTSDTHDNHDGIL